MIRWTEDDDARLRKLHAKGMPYAQIGEVLGRTKNQISGRVKRLGLAVPGRTPIIRLTDEEREQRKADRAAQKRRLPKPVLVRKPRPSDTIWRPRSCQFPEGHPGEPGFHFCGAALEPADGRSYCPEHHARCYLPPKQKGDGLAGDFRMHGWAA